MLVDEEEEEEMPDAIAMAEEKEGKEGKEGADGNVTTEGMDAAGIQAGVVACFTSNFGALTNDVGKATAVGACEGLRSLVAQRMADVEGRSLAVVVEEKGKEGKEGKEGEEEEAPAPDAIDMPGDENATLLNGTYNETGGYAPAQGRELPGAYGAINGIMQGV